ncbi:MAG: hypothetical protein K0S44_2498 [Bacteroidetes bacterium]|nr:hypothetical protein [Bacteroidota bacterium]
MEKLDFNMALLFKLWMVVLFFLFIGLFTRFASILNYLFSVLVFSHQHTFEYHVFYAYVGINFLLLFMPVSKTLSIDNLLEKLKYSSVGKFYKPDGKVYAINYFAPVMVGIGLVYIDSVLFKMISPMWSKGLGMWLPANLPHAIWNNLTFFMNNEYLVKGMGYFIIVFETIFIFCMWFKYFRWTLFVFGMFIHLGILICFPIPFFALAVIAVYLLMVPVGVWNKISFKAKRPTFTFYYDYECPLCVKTVVFIRHFDIFGMIACKSVQEHFTSDPLIQDIPQEQMLLEIYGVDRKNNKIYKGYETYVQLLVRLQYTAIIGYFMKLPGIRNIGKKIYKKVASGRDVNRCTQVTCSLHVLSEPIKDNEPIMVSWLSKDVIAGSIWKSLIIVLLVIQLVCSFFSGYPSELRQRIPGYTAGTEKVILKLAKPVRNFAQGFMGITNHPVFMDSHFKGYNHILKITYTDNNKEITLPIINDQGMPGEYVRGAFWVNFTFRVNSPVFRSDKFDKGIKPYLLHWLFKNKKDLSKSYDFKIYVKEIVIPDDWEENFLNKQIAKPWKEGGSINISNGKLRSSIDPTIL